MDGMPKSQTLEWYTNGFYISFCHILPHQKKTCKMQSRGANTSGPLGRTQLILLLAGHASPVGCKHHSLKVEILRARKVKICSNPACLHLHCNSFSELTQLKDKYSTTDTLSHGVVTMYCWGLMNSHIHLTTKNSQEFKQKPKEVLGSLCTRQPQNFYVYIYIYIPQNLWTLRRAFPSEATQETSQTFPCSTRPTGPTTNSALPPSPYTEKLQLLASAWRCYLYGMISGWIYLVKL